MLILGGVLGLSLGVVLLVLLRLVAPRLFPPQGGLHSQYYIGLLPTGRDATFSRRDYLRMAGLSLLGTVACAALIALVALVASRFPATLQIQRITEGAAFGVMLLALVAVLSTLLHIGHAIWWRPRRLASEWPNPEHAEDQESEP